MLNDAHIWDLAKRVTNKEELRDLGLKVLKVLAYKVNSTLYNENKIQNAAYELL